VWKAYIDLESELGEHENVRHLYERLLSRTSHVKVWISYAQFEASLPDVDAADLARKVFEQGDGEVKKSEKKEERKVLLDAWLAFEKQHGDAAQQQRVLKLMPTQVKKRREVFGEDGVRRRSGRVGDVLTMLSLSLCPRSRRRRAGKSTGTMSIPTSRRPSPISRLVWGKGGEDLRLQARLILLFQPPAPANGTAVEEGTDWTSHCSRHRPRRHRPR
jgi:hypothetical protein